MGVAVPCYAGKIQGGSATGSPLPPSSAAKIIIEQGVRDIRPLTPFQITGNYQGTGPIGFQYRAEAGSRRVAKTGSHTSTATMGRQPKTLDFLRLTDFSAGTAPRARRRKGPAHNGLPPELGAGGPWISRGAARTETRSEGGSRCGFPQRIKGPCAWPLDNGRAERDPLEWRTPGPRSQRFGVHVERASGSLGSWAQCGFGRGRRAPWQGRDTELRNFLWLWQPCSF
jgi:hypothetical protein